MYERLRNNITTLKKHVITHKPVIHITNGVQCENDLILEVAEDVNSILEKIHNKTLIEMPFKVGEKVAVRALCECIYTIPDNDECRNICPFEEDCPCDDCDDANERIIVTTINNIFNDGTGWKITFKHLCVEASIKDLGISFFVGENAEQQAEEYEKNMRDLC